LLTVSEKTVFFANHIFGTDNCNGTGRYPGRFSIKETATEILFYLHPCGSGGRLIQAGSSRRQSRFQKQLEQMETAAVKFAARRLRLPEALIKRVFPRMVSHFTQRKPYGLGQTRAAYSWSFDRKNTPYFCCQCGKIQEELGKDCLMISPPGDKGRACVWRFKK
jgi:hypothetical protein